MIDKKHYDSKKRLNGTDISNITAGKTIETLLGKEKIIYVDSSSITIKNVTDFTWNVITLHPITIDKKKGLVKTIYFHLNKYKDAEIHMKEYFEGEAAYDELISKEKEIFKRW